MSVKPQKMAISIHALLAESDNTGQPVRGLPSYFYPRSPCGERLPSYWSSRDYIRISIHALLAESDPMSKGDFDRIVFLSTLSLRRATILGNPCAGCPAISIHALLAESDAIGRRGRAARGNFYPRSPCGERPWQRQTRETTAEFLSTLSLRRATTKRLGDALEYLHFYPRSPCGERPPPAPQGESSKKFLSTLSLRRATMGLDGRFKL